MIWLLIIVFAGYTYYIIGSRKGLEKLAPWESDNELPVTQFSLIIPLRNEADNLPMLFKSIKEVNYDPIDFEILFINDASSDESVQLIQEFKGDNPKLSVKLLHSDCGNSSPKKRAIEVGVSAAAYPWIVATDADCSFGEERLKVFDQEIRTKAPILICGPVTYLTGSGFLHNFQLLDLLSLQAIGIGGFGIRRGFFQPFLCNGANLCYSKAAFEKVKGFKGSEHISSGDDVFLLEKMLREDKEKVIFTKSFEAMVYTRPLNSYRNLLAQRVRWASKTTAFSSNIPKVVGLLTLAVNGSLIALLVMSLINPNYWFYLGLVYLVKFNIDFLLLFSATRFFRQEQAMRSYFISSLFYPFHFFIVAASSLFPFDWKGRKYHK